MLKGLDIYFAYLRAVGVFIYPKLACLIGSNPAWLSWRAGPTAGTFASALNPRIGVGLLSLYKLSLDCESTGLYPSSPRMNLLFLNFDKLLEFAGAVC